MFFIDVVLDAIFTGNFAFGFGLRQAFKLFYAAN